MMSRKTLMVYAVAALLSFTLLFPFLTFAMSTATNGYALYTPDTPGQANSNDGHWIIDPAHPEPDIPSVGQSLFDLVFSSNQPEKPDYQIPYPFSKLEQHISDQLELSATSIKKTRIPIGRSLRRNAVAPDYFNYPRIVIAADAEPVNIPGQAGLNLKGRLFLGYQEQSNLLEVISYNPEAGRFEFQEVRNYGPGLIPSVAYANRALCLSCHQNAGPIFPREPWLETDSNLRVSARLPTRPSNSNVKAIYLPRFDNVWAIDYATDRANYLSSSQFIWIHGCAQQNASDLVESIQCRSAILAAILQYRLTGHIDQNSRTFREWFVPVVKKNWELRWPDGLVIATADIADKDPFEVASVPAQDPLNPRLPRATWSKPSPHLLSGILYQIADFFTEQDIVRLDKFLQQQAIIKNTPVIQYDATCSIASSGNTDEQHVIRFSCGYNNSLESSVFQVKGSLFVDNKQVTQGNIEHLGLPHLANDIRFLDLGEARVNEESGSTLRASIPINKRDSRLSARVSDGRRIELLELRWPKIIKANHTAINQPATLTLINDYEPLRAAIKQMILATESGEIDALTSKPLRRHSLLKALHLYLGMPPLYWSHDNNAPQPAPNSNALLDNPMASYSVFYEHCSTCHANEEKFPPGFLNGSKSTVARQLVQCAKNILHRLNMWNYPSIDRLVSPMPPSSWLHTSGLSETEWLKSNALEEMRLLARQLLETNQPLPAQLNPTTSLCE